MRMIKSYTDCNYGKIQVSKNGSKDEKEENTQNYNNDNEESKKILDYLNKFKLKEIGNEEASKNEKSEVFCITFYQCYDEHKNQLKSSKKLIITFYNNNMMQVTTSDKYKSSKYYKITEGNVDFKYINKILSNTEKI
ncbi:hypothetical protein C3495_13635 (plasmid) [Clostridiaceae bacterium 14S0207]|nr:hypothetical protein C3495_13635 [Clostridiaceae bacterium 14S0207]